MGRLFIQYMAFIGLIGVIVFYLSWRFFSWVGKRANREVDKIKGEMVDGEE